MWELLNQSFDCFQTHIPSHSNKTNGHSPNGTSPSLDSSLQPGSCPLPGPASPQPLNELPNGSHIIVLPSPHEINVFDCFSAVLSHIHLLWELVLTAEPIVVMSSVPTICSDMVQALVRWVLYHWLFICKQGTNTVRKFLSLLMFENKCCLVSF